MPKDHLILSETAKGNLISAIVEGMGLQRIHLQLINELSEIGVDFVKIEKQSCPDYLRLGLNVSGVYPTRIDFEEEYQRRVHLDEVLPHDENNFDRSIFRRYKLSPLYTDALDTIVEFVNCDPV